MNTTGSVVVAYDYKESSDTAVLIVGQKNPKMDIQIINAFDGEEATELWEKLTVYTRKPKL